MQRVTPRRHSVRMIVALVAAVMTSALTTAAFGASAQSAPVRQAHLCPPAC